MWTTAPWPVPCSTGWRDPSPRSPPTVRTTKTASTPASPRATPRRPWSCRRARPPCPAGRPRASRRGATAVPSGTAEGEPTRRDRRAQRDGRGRAEAARPPCPAGRPGATRGGETAVPSGTAEGEPTRRDRHLRHIAEHGRMAWQKASGYTRRARAEAATGRWKQVIGDGLRAHADQRRATEVDVAVHALNRMSELGRPSYVRTA